MATSTYLPNEAGQFAYLGNSSSYPCPDEVIDNAEAAYNITQRNRIAVDDSNGVNAGGAFMSHRIQFDLAEDPADITQLDFRCDATSLGPGGFGDVGLFVWDDANSTYGSVQDSAASLFSNQTFTVSITSNIADYIDSNGQISFLLMGNGGSAKTAVTMEYAVLTVTYTSTAPEMAVSGNSVEIADGDATPSTADHTDFGNAVENSGTVSRTFTITNSGDAELTLSGTPRVAVSGTHAAMFTVTSQPSTPVAVSGGTTTFTVEFAPTSTGVKTATLSIANNDSDEDPYNFDIQGTGIEAPAATTAVFRKMRGQG